MYTSSNMYGKDEMDQNNIPMHAGGQMQAQQQGHGGYMPVQHHMHYQTQPSVTSAQAAYMMSAGPVDYSQPPVQAYDRFPLVCSIIAMLCCPISIFCSLPAMVCSLCGYTDYRVHDLPEFRKKTDCSRRLVITACIIALAFWVGGAISAFWFYKQIFALAQEMTNNYRLRNPNYGV